MVVSKAEDLVENILKVDLGVEDAIRLIVLIRLDVAMLEFLHSHLRMHRHPMQWFQVHL